MKAKNAMFAIVAVMLMSIAVIPVADIAADDEGEMILVSTGPLSDDDERNYVFEALLILIIVLIFAGALHVKARGVPKPPKFRK